MPPPCALLLSASPEEKEGSLVHVASTTLLEAHVGALRRAQVAEIAIAWAGEAHEVPPGCGSVTVVLQPDWRATMFDSLVLGLFALGRGPVLVLPSTNDLVDDDTLEILVAETQDAPDAMAIVPRYGDQHGHPVALSWEAIEAVVRDAVDPHGIHRLDRLLAHWPRVRPVDVSDEAVTRTFPRIDPRPG